MSQQEQLRQGAGTLGISLTGQQAEQLIAYAELILKWNKVYNLTALRDPAAVMTHHLLDSLAAVGPLQRDCAEPTKLLDVGAGAGLPGVVVSILRADIEVTCVDAVAKKAAFIQQVASELGLRNLRGLHARVETLSGTYGVITSRAFASLSDFVLGSVHLLAPEGVWMAMKGKTPTDEITQLPPQAEVFHVEQLTVPGLEADRCIVWMRKPAG